MNKCVLFDLDGTLIDSAPGVAWSLNKALAAEGRAALSVERVKDLVGKGALHLVADALADTGGMIDDVQRDRVKDAFLDIYAKNPIQDTIVFPGVFEVLQSLKEAGVPMALCTNKPKITTMPVLDAFGLTPFFPVILCGDEVAHRKPDGRHVLDTIKALGTDPACAVMVGDSENDILAAQDAGVPTICVSFGYCHMPFEELKPSVLIDSFDDFHDALASIVASSKA
ncbi:MAG: phosphoglycolate phosphatase [Rhodospirillales bacterium]